MISVPVEIAQYISQFVEPTPTVYLNLAQISRSFYTVFTCDRLWKPFNVYGVESGIVYDYTRRVNGKVLELLEEVYRPNNIVARDEIDESFLNERYVQLALASSDGVCLYLHNWEMVKVHRDVAVAAVKLCKRAYKFLDPQLQNDREIVLATQCNPVQYITDKSLYRDREVVLSLASRYGLVLEHAPEFAGDRQVMLAAVKNDAAALMYAHPTLLTDYEVCTSAGPKGIQYIPHDMPYYREVLLNAIKLDWRVLEHASAKHRDDEGIIQKAIAQSGEALRFASDRLRKDRSIILASGFMAFFYAHPSVRENKDIVLPLMKAGRCTLQTISQDLQADFDVVLAAVTKRGDQLQYTSEEFQNNNQIVEAAVQQNPHALKYASLGCRNSQDLVMTAVSQDGLALQHAGSKARRLREVVITAVANNGAALRYAGSTYRGQSDIVELACMTCPDAIRMTTPEYRESRGVQHMFTDSDCLSDMDDGCVEPRFVA